MTIFLKDIMKIENPLEFKAHFAKSNGHIVPLDAFVKGSLEARSRWHEYRSKRNDFNRHYVLSFFQFYHEVDVWLFEGIYKILERFPDRYQIQLTNIGEEFIGRLKVDYKLGQRACRTNLENHLDKLLVREILPESFSGRVFPGYHKTEIRYNELEALVQKGNSDWGDALGNVKGIYLITDEKANKRYVGSAYGDEGLWSRWRSYIETGHGGNADMRLLVKEKGHDYCRANFRFALLEQISFSTPKKNVIEREDFWKGVLRSRGEHGLNRN